MPGKRVLCGLGVIVCNIVAEQRRASCTGWMVGLSSFWWQCNVRNAEVCVTR